MADSLIIKAARLHHVEAGGALAVDREGYSEYVTNVIKNCQCTKKILTAFACFYISKNPSSRPLSPANNLAHPIFQLIYNTFLPTTHLLQPFILAFFTAKAPQIFFNERPDFH